MEDESMQRCQRCGTLAWDWLCWPHYEEWQELAEREETEQELQLLAIERELS